MQKIVVFGTGDFAQVAQVYLSKDSPYEVVAFTVHEQYITQPSLLGLDIVPFEHIEERFPPDTYGMFVAVGFKKVNRARTEIYHLCKAKGYNLISYLNSKATYWDPVNMGDNCFILENNVIQPFVTIGSNVIIWSGNHIGHHATIGDHCFIASHVVISGHVTIGQSCFIGVNATFRDGITVAPDCVIGAGAIILKDTIEKGVYKTRGTEPTTIPSDKLRGF